MNIYAYDSWLPEDPDQPQGDFRHFNEEGVYELAPLGENRWKLTVVVPAEYLNHPALVYPVTIDPSYTTTAVPNGSSVVSDVFFDENGTCYNTDYLRFGNTAGGTIDSYIRFDSFSSYIPARSYVNSYIDHYAVDMYEFARKWRTGYFPNYGVRLTYASSCGRQTEAISFSPSVIPNWLSAFPAPPPQTIRL